MLPAFVIVGAQKAGTTFLHEALRRHPALFLPRYETPFFEDPFYDPARVDRLESVLRGARPGQIPGIKRPDYLAQPACAPRLARHLPRARLIAMLRPPADRAISAYFWYAQVGLIPARPLADGLADLLQGDLAARHPRAVDILEYGCYGRQLRHLASHFPREQILVLLMDELRAGPEAILARVADFLGVDPAGMPADLGRRPKQAVYGLPRLRWLAVANRRFFYRPVPGAAGPALARREALPAQLAYYFMVAVDRVVLRRLVANDPPALPPDLAFALADYYREDIADLEAYLERDLSAWKTTP